MAAPRMIRIIILLVLPFQECLEGHEGLVCRLISPISHVIIPVISGTNLLTKSP